MSPELPFLAVDAGSTFTKAYVLDDVDGERRLVAVGRSATQADDGQPLPEQAAARAVAQALAIAGRGATGARVQALQRSRPAPRVLVVAASEDAAREATTRLGRLPLRVLDPLVLAPSGGAAAEQVLAALEELGADAVVFAGSGAPGQGSGRALRSAVEALRYGATPPLPHVVALGDEAFTGALAPLLEGLPHEAAVPTDGEALARVLAPLLAESPLDGVRIATEMVAERYDVDVLTLDLGAGHAMGVIASGTTGQRRVTSLVRDDLGLRHGRAAILAAAGAESVLRWMPLDVSLEALRGDARRGAIAPASVPETPEELLLDHAFAREALSLLLAEVPAALGRTDLPAIDLLIGSGGVLASVPRLIQAALILLDAVQPEALTQLALDRATALPLLGYLGGTHGHQSVGASLERDGLLNLGLCIAPSGVGREGEPAIRVEVAYATRSPVTVEVPFGAIEVVSLAAGERAALKLWPSRDFDVGLGRGNAATPRAEVEGGAVGIIIDARGRPLVLPDAGEKRQAKLIQWLQGTRAYPQLSFVQSDAHSDRGAVAPESEG